MSPASSSPPELTAVLTSLDEVGPRALTSCPGWSAQHVAAHLCGNYEEIHRHVQAFAAGRPLEHTRPWEEREAPLRELRYPDLLHRIESEAATTGAAITAVVDQQPDATLRWTGRSVEVSGLATHLRSEDALHRWDLVGDDDSSRELLGAAELLAHAVKFIGSPLLQRGLSAGAGSEPFLARIRCVGEDDLIVRAGGGEADLSIGPALDAAAIEADPGARLLLLWGRKPMPFSRLQLAEEDGREVAARAQALLAGY